MQYTMRTDTDCGPAALSAAADVEYDRVMAAWPHGFRGNASDSPWHHDAAMAALGIKRRIATCMQILMGSCPENKTVVLLHAFDNPLMNQHWAVLAGSSGGIVSMHMGNGQIKVFNQTQFEQLYCGATPACAYVVGEGEVPRLSWYQRAWLWLSSTRIVRSIMG